jgi:hypothetical protein
LADFVAKVGCCRRVVGHLVKANGFDPPALALFTQFQRYVMHRT